MRSITALLTGLALALVLAACQKTSTTVTADDMSMGKADAPVTVIEYASVSCPHCADWGKEVFPAFKTKYIDSDKVRFVFREALTSDPAIAAAGFLTARCAGKDKYFQVVDAIYRAQPEMYQSGDPHAVLLRIAQSAGLTDAQFDACIKDETALNALNNRWNRYVTEDHINATPTFVINGKTYDQGGLTLAQMDTAVAQAAGGKAAS